MKFHTFYTDNLPEKLIEDHQNVCNHIDLEVQYHSEEFTDYDGVYTAHGKFMTSVMEKEEVACFLDIDCLPHNKELIKKAYNWAVENKSFVGNAQNISHTQMRNHIYAAASCLIVTKDAWNILGNPDFSWFMQNNTQVDTAQILTLRADEIGFPYQLMYPIGYDEDDLSHCFVNDYGITTHKKSLGSYGNYGIGTLYPATYHYFRISEIQNQLPNLWTTRVNNILEDQKIIPHHFSCFYGL
jgi:hypothetical protein